MYRLLPLLMMPWVVALAPIAIAMDFGRSPLPTAEFEVSQATMDEWESELRQLIEQDPNDAAAYVNLGDYLLDNTVARSSEAQEQADLEGIAAYRQAIQLASNNAEVSLKLAKKLNYVDNPEMDRAVIKREVVSFTRRAVQLNPNSAEAYSLLSSLLFQGDEKMQKEGDVANQKARDLKIILARKAVRLNPKSAEAYFELGELLCLGDAKMEKEGISALQRAIELKPDYAEAYESLGWRLSDKVSEKTSIKELKIVLNIHLKLLNLKPKNSDAYVYAGRILEYLGRNSEAIEMYRQAEKYAMKNNYDLLTSSLEYGNLEITVGRLRESKIQESKPIALKILRRFLSGDPSDVLSYSDAILDLLLILGKNEEFKYELNRYISFIKSDESFGKPEDGKENYFDKNICVEMSRTLNKHQRFNEGIELLKVCLDKLPESDMIYRYLGHTFYEMGRVSDAIPAYKKAYQINPTLSMNIFSLGKAFYGEGKLQEAKREFRRVLSLKDSPYEFAWAHHGLGLVFQKEGDLEEALQEFQHAAAIDPDLLNVQRYIKEVQRQLALRNTPKLVVKDDRAYVPHSSDPMAVVLRSTVKVIPQLGEGEDGTGWVVKREGNMAWIVTNRHVVAETQNGGSGRIEVEFYSTLPGERRLRIPATLEKMTTTNDILDLAVIKVVGLPDDVQAFKMQAGQSLLNQRIRIVGHPFNIGDWSSVSGEIVNRQGSFLVINATAGTGNSGSPVINEKNQVIGLILGVRSSRDPEPRSKVNLKTATATAGVAQAYPIDLITDQLRAWNIL